MVKSNQNRVMEQRTFTPKAPQSGKTEQAVRVVIVGTGMGADIDARLINSSNKPVKAGK